MATIRDFLTTDEMAIQAYGTSEGAEKGWDTRGRGRAAKNFAPPSSVDHKAVWGSLKKVGFKEVGSRRSGIRTFTMNKQTPPSRFDGEIDNYHHRIDIKSDGSWRHTKGPVSTNMAVGRVTGRNLDQLNQHLTSGQYQTSFRNVGSHGRGWEDVAETR